MIRRPVFYPAGSLLANVCSLRTMFNNILNDAVARRKHRILSIRSCDKPEHFEKNSSLTDCGRTSFWWELDSLLEWFEMGEIKLLPRRIKNGKKGKNNYDTNDRDNRQYEYYADNSGRQLQQQQPSHTYDRDFNQQHYYDNYYSN